MDCYLITLDCVGESGGCYQHLFTVYALDYNDLTEQIMEYQEDFEETSKSIVINKTVKQITCT